ncbi:SDR family oxidoreductase [Halioglobus maricola]|uniref:SDR family oxidoreductase n=1 Tax=Halioglobus maricola TaxID=2601894 RepID=A0A5P9NH77_9GAMM|nr:SDR family NAD(P)-dependent oxidoreductase [Halioglobus maricola]QFU75151.1 SDR family oxidoreductase [Halioglobus maricola]
MPELDSRALDLLQPFLLTDKVALVTGASSGFGREFADALSAAGAKVVLAARRLELIEAARDEIIASGGEAMAVAMDITDSASIARALDAVETQFGTVTIVVNNAGISMPRPLLEMDDDAWNQVVATNLSGAAYVTRETASRMVAAGAKGSVVNIASILAVRVQSFLTSYAAAKAGLVQFTKNAALELAQHGIRVNAICPGYFATDITRAWLASEEGQALQERIPQRRVGDISELFGPLLLLASDAGSHMTGASIVIDGGHVLSEL